MVIDAEQTLNKCREIWINQLPLLAKYQTITAIAFKSGPIKSMRVIMPCQCSEEHVFNEADIIMLVIFFPIYISFLLLNTRVCHMHCDIWARIGQNKHITDILIIYGTIVLNICPIIFARSSCFANWTNKKIFLQIMPPERHTIIRH